MMNLYLPIAEMPINILSVFAVSCGVGILSILLGLSGGFILSPFLISLGIPPSVIVGSTGIQSFTTSFNAFFNYLKQDDIPVKIATILTLGGLVGVTIGVKGFEYISSIYNINLVVKYAFIVLLVVVFFLTYLSEKKNKNTEDHQEDDSLQNLQTSKGLSSLLFIGLSIGIISSFLGIGGGLLIMPILKFFYKPSDKTAICLSQTNIVFTSLLALLMHAGINSNFDPFLSILLLISGLVGSQIGLIIYDKFPRKLAYYLFCILIFMTISSLLYGIINETPKDCETKKASQEIIKNEVIINEKEPQISDKKSAKFQPSDFTNQVKSYSKENPFHVVGVAVGIAIFLSMVLNWITNKMRKSKN